ncbi:MAG: hypothetical protein H6641_03105 [Caldilineaceae bacterium]|nr:hypothetical protein [Caldilineaceae bacterium]
MHRPRCGLNAIGAQRQSVEQVLGRPRANERRARQQAAYYLQKPLGARFVKWVAGAFAAERHCGGKFNRLVCCVLSGVLIGGYWARLLQQPSALGG